MAKKEVDTGAQGWIKTISTYDAEFKKWESRVDKILKRYRDDPQNVRGYNTAKFNILWSNVQTAIPAVYARLPVPDVSRRFRDNDPVGRVAALLLERALTYEIEHYPDYRATLEQCVLDRFLGGRGTTWVRYEPHIQAIENTPDDGFQITEDADEAQSSETEPQEEIEYECSPTDYVHWKEFGHTPARTWEEVTAVWRKVYMDRDALIERFGEEVGSVVPLDTRPEELKKTNTADIYQAVIYEIWDKKSGKAMWLSKSMGKVLDERDDPLELENFWPCPRPLFATLTNESLVPTPDFALYQDQADSLDLLSDRINGLIKAMQVKGCYDASVPELARLFTEGENNSLIPVKNWQAFAEKAGLKGAINLVELQPIYQALQAAYGAMAQQKQQIYEVTGLSDIIRGSTNANETATAQQLKGQYGSMRLKAMQAKVAAFASEILQIKAQIICKFYQPQTLIQIGGAAELSENDQQYVPQAIQLLKDANLRAFRIDIEADSMTMLDEQQEKTDRMEFLKATSDFLKSSVPAAQQAPELAPLLMEMLKFGVTGFKIGKTIEGEFDAMADKLKQASAQPQPQKPDPEAMKLQSAQQQQQMQLQHDAQVAQQNAQVDMQKHQAEMAQRQQEQQMQAQIEQHKNEMEAQRAAVDAQNTAQIEQMKMQHESSLESQRLAFEKWKAELAASTSIVTAQISAKTTMDSALLSAQKSASNEVTEEVGDAQPDIAGMHVEAMNKIGDALAIMSKPKTVIRGDDGKVIGVQ